jgi:hypothetical protein
MLASETVRRLGKTCLVCLTFTISLALLPPVQAQNRIPAPPRNSGDAQPDLTDPNNIRPVTQNDSLLSKQGGQRLMAEAIKAVESQNYAVAVKKLQESRQVFNQLSNFYQQLFTSFTGIDNRIADSQRRQSVEAADMRDQATYQLALVHRAQNQRELAVPLLIQIIRSQNPSRDLGKKAYQQLFELGFVDSPYAPNTSAPPSASSSGQQK